ncbi:MAG: sugar-transfer associated ATP-grasp domain-containing protein [Balneolaceae bacterium]
MRDSPIKKLLLTLLKPYFFYKNKRRYIRKISKIERKTFSNLKLKELGLEEESKQYFKNFGYKIDTTWHKLYYLSNTIRDKKYIPENLYYLKLEPKLNDYNYYWIYSNKMIFHRLLNVHSNDLLYKINNEVYDHNYNKITNNEYLLNLKYPLLIKDIIGTQGGKGIIKINNYDSLTTVLKKRNNIIVQKYIRQHNFFKKLNSTSLNTIRIMTLSFNGLITVLSGVIRIGKEGEIVDNQSSGGFTIGIDSNGYTKNYLYNKNFEKFEFKKPDSDYHLNNLKVPFYAKILSFVKKLHAEIPFIGIISWDVAINEENEILIIEMNVKEQGINIHQLNNGPLFGDLTSQVLDYCKNH